jgi:gamma-glutamyl phosphate reductase
MRLMEFFFAPFELGMREKRMTKDAHPMGILHTIKERQPYVTIDVSSQPLPHSTAMYTRGKKQSLGC